MSTPAVSGEVEHISRLGFRIWRKRPNPQTSEKMLRAHAHSDIEVNYVLQGSIHYFFGGRFLKINPGELGVFWGGIPHQSLLLSDDLAGVWMILPLSWALGWKHAARLGATVIGGNAVVTNAERTDEAFFYRWADEMRGEVSPALREVVVSEIEARLSRLSLSLKESGSGSRRTEFGPLARMEEVTDFLGSHYTEDLSVAQVAAAMRFHPKYLLRFFREKSAITLWDYVVQLRLAHALRLLIATDKTVLEIALESGFGSLSGFYHAFQKHSPGRSPSEYRTARNLVESPLRPQ